MSTAPRRWAPTAIVVAAVGAAVAIPLTLGIGTDTAAAVDGHLEVFPTCDALTDYAVTAAIENMDTAVPPPMSTTGTADTSQRSAGAAEAATPSHSTTNVQIAGIDEPDMVKTDGKWIYAIADDTLYAVDTTGATPRVATSIDFPDGFESSDLILSGNRLLVIGNAFSGRSIPPTGAAPTTSRQYTGTRRTVMLNVDVSTPGQMRIIDRLATSSTYETARLSDGTVRVVLSGPTPSYPTSYRSGLTGAIDNALAMRELKTMSASDWLPSYQTQDADGNATSKEVTVPCKTVSRPAGDAVSPRTVTVLTIDPAKGIDPVDQDTLMGAATTTMMSPDNLYLTSTTRQTGKTQAQTRIHVLDVSRPNVTSYRATGTVDGYLLNQFSLDEHDGVLRVATTRQENRPVPTDVVMDEPPLRPGTDSAVTTMRVSGRTLEKLGEVTGLGQDERIYSVRFMGERAYVVTFRQTDPLYAIDLSDPSNPRETGELKINGYSAYLHPVDETHIIGVGQDATDTGRRLGTQVSLFDVSDPASPKRVAQWTAPNSSSGVDWDHHAFLWWNPTSTAVIPVRQYGRDQYGETSAVALKVENGTMNATDLRQSPYPTGPSSPIQRSLAIGDTLYTLSKDGLVARDLSTLDNGTWVSLD